MASRPIFISSSSWPYVTEELVDFEWHRGLAISQKQKSINSLHLAANDKFEKLKILEISTKSLDPLGIKLSAFNLEVKLKTNKFVPLENVFQSSKVFDRGGPYKDLLYMAANEVKSDKRLKESGNLIGFSSNGKLWPLEPKTIFYDWLYINTVFLSSDLSSEILKYRAFTDIEFNPKKSFNCQARSAALFVSLWSSGELKKCIESSEYYLELLSASGNNVGYKQSELF
ncbi:DarT1-associated NADAR antitoxin family protein [Rheinheimera texasensis]|uniref:DarT1-associated NADAR antitoxin family protein n=1 Tax=Rheinheimera texasensis TaxID=306205 RepID=UPI0004E18F65|nr:hypothetical protein [Rheinheimera texasensis]